MLEENKEPVAAKKEPIINIKEGSPEHVVFLTSDYAM